MKNTLGSIILVTSLLFALSSIADDKVVVIPLNGNATTTHYFTLPGAVFNGNTSAGHNTDGTISVGVNKDYYAPVILPNGAKLTEFAVYAKNNSTSVNDDVSLMLFDLATTTSTVMATATIPWGTGTFTKFVAPSITPDVIDNISGSYAVTIHSGDGQLDVSAIRITYNSK